MLEIVIPEAETFTEDRAGEGTFGKLPEVRVQLEHSLLSISKWESNWNVAFLGDVKKTPEMIMDYIQCMVVGKPLSVSTLNRLTEAHIAEINAYIYAPMTATKLRENPNEKKSQDVTTSELIYYWMIALNIPFECQKWHLTRLLTLIKVCNAKNNPGKKMSPQSIMAQNKSLNEQRKKQLGTSG